MFIDMSSESDCVACWCLTVTEAKKAQQELRKAAVDAARIQKKVKKGCESRALKAFYDNVMLVFRMR